MEALERARSAQADVEAYERGVMETLREPAPTARARVRQGHKVRRLLERVQERSAAALASLEDADGVRRDAVAALRGEGRPEPAGEAAFAAFDELLRRAAAYHAKHPGLRPAHEPDWRAEAEAAAAAVQFSGEEMGGKYVDLHELHERARQLPQLRVPDYVGYLDTFADFAAVPAAARTAAYAEYAEAVGAYLLDFLRRTQPMGDAPAALEAARRAFADGYSDAAVESNPLFCAACAKLFGNPNVFERHLTGKKHLRAASRAASSGGGDAVKEAKRALRRRCAEAEAAVAFLAERLSDVVAATRARVERKQTRTYDELMAELADEEEAEARALRAASGGGGGGGDGDDDDDDDDEDAEDPLGSNPKNLPIGWDGQPIPYWLYKLHGLSVEYRCEICGDASYYGKRAYDRHFREPRHAHGMRCLGIPNSNHFRDVTRIADAIALYGLLQQKAAADQFAPEFEDSAGNVVDKRTYEDMARNGLL